MKWKSGAGNIFSGFLRPDIEIYGKRKVIGKIWKDGAQIPSQSNFVAYEVDMQRSNFIELSNPYHNCSSLEMIKGEYILRTSGKYAKTINKLLITDQEMSINDIPIKDYKLSKGVLSWSGGNMECFTGEIMFVVDPILSTTEIFGKSKTIDATSFTKCYGSVLVKEPYRYTGPEIPEWAGNHLASIVGNYSQKGGLMLWYKWEKHNFLTRLANRLVLNFNLL